MPSDRERTIAIGCQEFETKPMNLERLLQKMQTLLDKVDDVNEGTSQPLEWPVGISAGEYGASV
jgi:hypothetical protein